MKKLIYRYLSSTYRVKGNHIYLINDTRTFGIRANILTLDIKKVLGITKNELKWYLKGWIKKQNKGFDFNRYWHYKLAAFDRYINANYRPNGLWYMEYTIERNGSEAFNIEVNRMADYFNAPILVERNPDSVDAMRNEMRNQYIHGLTNPIDPNLYRSIYIPL